MAKERFKERLLKKGNEVALWAALVKNEGKHGRKHRGAHLKGHRIKVLFPTPVL